MTENKRKIIRELCNEYNIRSTANIGKAMRNVKSDIIQEIKECETGENFGCGCSGRSDNTNCWNGYKSKFVSIYHRSSHWIDRNFGPDRLTIQPRRIKDTSTEKYVDSLKKLYRSHQKTNIAVTGGKSVGKKSVVKTFEDQRVMKFIHLDLREFAALYRDIINSDSLQAKFDKYFLEWISSRARQGELSGSRHTIRDRAKSYRKALNTIVWIVLMAFIYYAKDQLVDNIAKLDIIPETWELTGISLVISIVCITSVVLLLLRLIRFYVAYRPFEWFKIKFTSKTSLGELTVNDSETSSIEYQKEIIYTLREMRWKIGYTVVFENMEALGEEAFSKIVMHLCIFNRRINEHLTAWKLWKVTPIKRPIHFIYIFRSDLVQLEMDKPLYDEIIYILPTITADNAFYELERAFNVEMSKGASFPVNELFPIDPNYEVNVSKYITDRRILNLIVKRSIQMYSDFEKRLQSKSVSKSKATTELDSETEHTVGDDIHGLFSFVLYSLFFPNDCLKFADNSSIIFTNSNMDGIDKKYLDLFIYLISEKCPEQYRITYLSMRFVGL